jgi:sec-independent protein translocase protein TatC
MTHPPDVKKSDEGEFESGHREDPLVDPIEESRMPLWGHLHELRQGMIRSLVIVSLAFCVSYSYVEPLIVFLERPLLDLLPEGNRHLYFTGLTDKFFIYLKVSFLAAACLVSPYLLYEVWRFISPALHKHERKFAGPFIFLGSFAFFVGLAFSYYVVIPFGYKFLLEFGSPTDQAMITLTEYFSLTLKMLMALGLVFEVPVVMVLLGKFGIINAPMLQKNRHYAFVVCSVVAAIATPSPDAFTMLLVMVPLYCLYELGIIGVKWAYPKN